MRPKSTLSSMRILMAVTLHWQRHPSRPDSRSHTRRFIRTEDSDRNRGPHSTLFQTAGIAGGDSTWEYQGELSGTMRRPKKTTHDPEARSQLWPGTQTRRAPLAPAIRVTVSRDESSSFGARTSAHTGSVKDRLASVWAVTLFGCALEAIDVRAHTRRQRRIVVCSTRRRNPHDKLGIEVQAVADLTCQCTSTR